jgi:hypothetical protein
MNVEIGAEAAKFPEKEYINVIAFAVLTINCLKLAISEIPYILLTVSCDIFLKSIDQLLAWESGLKVPFIIYLSCDPVSVTPEKLVESFLSSDFCPLIYCWYRTCSNFARRRIMLEKLIEKIGMSIFMFFYFRSENSQRHACTV